MEILVVAPIPLMLLGIIYGIINLIRKNILEATTWGLVAVIGFLLLTLALQSINSVHKDIRIISLENKLKELETKKENTLNHFGSGNLAPLDTRP